MPMPGLIVCSHHSIDTFRFPERLITDQYSEVNVKAVIPIKWNLTHMLHLRVCVHTSLTTDKDN